MHADWKHFLEQQGFEVTQVQGAARARARTHDADPAATRCIDLNHFAALTLLGPDASSFLEGYLTCEMASLTEARALQGAYCNIKGRVVADAIVLLLDAQPTLLLHASLREEVVTSLRKYLAFSRSRFADADAAPVLLGIVNPPPAAGLPSEPLTVIAFRGGHAVAMPGTQARVLLLLPGAQAQAVWLEYAAQYRVGDAAIWDLLDVRDGIAHVDASTSGTFLPQMLDYDKAGAISFTKGCYLGQEIVARTQHLGRAKRHLHALQWSGAIAPSVGAALADADNNKAGTVVAVAHTAPDRGEALAVLNDGSPSALYAGGATFVGV